MSVYPCHTRRRRPRGQGRGRWVTACGALWVCTDTPGALLSPERAAPVSGAKPTGEGGTTVALGNPATEGPGVTPGGSRETRGGHTSVSVRREREQAGDT